MDKKKDVKKPKKKGPIRTGAVVPFFIITTIIILFNIFLLDSTIKATLKFALEKVNGAQVDIAKVSTSFKDLRVRVEETELTNRDEPLENILEIGNIDFQLSWDALLRGKILINHSNINNIQVGTKRSSKGEVFPIEVDEKTGNSKATQEMLDKAEKEFAGNVFGDIAGLLGGGSTGDIVKNIEGTLESKKKFEEIGKSLKQRKNQLDQDIKALPSKKDISDLEKRAKAIRWKDLGNLLKAPGVLMQADKLNKDINKAIKSYKKVVNNVEGTFKEIDQSYKQAQALVEKDIKSVGKRMNLPTLDQASIARMLFGPEVLDKLKEVKKYQKMAEKYMPPKKENKETVVTEVKRKRGKGKNYKFGKPNSYPLFWLKFAQIDSQNDQGKVKGVIKNITNDQVATGVLTTAYFDADFPSLELRNIKSKAEIDHRKSPLVNFEGSIGKNIVYDKVLSKSKDAKFILAKSNVATQFNGQLRANQVSLGIKNQFSDIKYDVGSKNKVLDVVLKDVAKKTKMLDLNAKVKGKWDALRFNINSNLASAIQTSVRSLIKEKIEAARRKIRDNIQKEVNKSKAKVDNEINKLKSQYNRVIADAKKEVNQVKSKIAAEKKRAEKKAKKSFKNPLKGLKGFKF